MTSQTRSGRSGCHDRSLPALQRLVAPGMRCAAAPAGMAFGRGVLLGPVAPGMVGEGVAAQRRQLLRQVAPRRHRERRRHADVMEHAGVVVEAEQERADRLGAAFLAALVPAKAGDDAVGRARVLDLQHRPLARLVRRVERLGDDAVEAGALEFAQPAAATAPSRVTGVR